MKKILACVSAALIVLSLAAAPAMAGGGKSGDAPGHGGGGSGNSDSNNGGVSGANGNQGNDKDVGNAGPGGE